MQQRCAALENERAELVEGHRIELHRVQQEMRDAATSSRNASPSPSNDGSGDVSHDRETVLEFHSETPMPELKVQDIVAQMTQVHNHRAWQYAAARHVQLFFATSSNNNDGTLTGISYLIDNNKQKAIDFIGMLIEAAHIYLHETPRATEFRGLWAPSLEPSFLHSMCTIYSVLFIGADSVLTRYIRYKPYLTYKQRQSYL